MKPWVLGVVMVLVMGNALLANTPTLDDAPNTANVIELRDVKPGTERLVLATKNDYLRKEVDKFRSFKDTYFMLWTWLIIGVLFVA